MNDSIKGVVVSLSRRIATVRGRSGQPYTCQLSPNQADLIIGDHVSFVPSEDTSSTGNSNSGGRAVVVGFEERTHVMYRSYFGRTKTLACNLDHVFIVTAPTPLFNRNFIDRAIAAASYEDIPLTVLMNKSDLDSSMWQEELASYRNIPIDTLLINTLSNEGLAPLRKVLSRECLKKVLLCGVSGVGKTSILNALIPSITRRTQEVSGKTGQGRQTTTQSFAHPYHDNRDTELLIIDSPGLQNFGLTHIPTTELFRAFPEMMPFVTSCQFADCSHRHEKRCAIKIAVAADEIAPNRYESYLQILDELERVRKY